MLISIQTKQCRFSPRVRHSIEKYVQRALQREQHQIDHVSLTIRRTTVARGPIPMSNSNLVPLFG
jgi:hypothetical protein